MNPTNHLSAAELEQYRRGQLPSEKREECERHLAECAKCCAVARSTELARTAAHWRAELTAATREEPCLTEEQILGYLKQEALSPALHFQKAQMAHLAACADCQVALEEMRELQASLSVTRVQAPVPKNSGRVFSISEKKKKSSVFLPHWSWPKIGWAMAAAALALIGVFLWQTPWMGDRGHDLVQNVTPTPLPQDSIPSTPSVIATPASVLPALVLPALVLNDADGQVILSENGKLDGLEQLPEDTALAVKTAMQTQSVRLPSTLAELNQVPPSSASTLMGQTTDQADAEKKFRVLQPRGQIVRTTQPEFRWQPLEGATSYVVTVFQSDFSEITVSQPVTTTFWKPEKPLPGGRVLFWQVRAVTRTEERVTPSLAETPAKFQVLDQALNDRLHRIEKTHANSHLTMGVLYAQAGLKEEAAAHFRALLKANPESSLAKKLLASVNR